MVFSGDRWSIGFKNQAWAQLCFGIINGIDLLFSNIYICLYFWIHNTQCALCKLHDCLNYIEVSRIQKRHFSLHFFGEYVFKILTLTPRRCKAFRKHSYSLFVNGKRNIWLEITFDTFHRDKFGREKTKGRPKKDSSNLCFYFKSWLIRGGRKQCLV
jgi:hypothetical protein